MRKLKPGYAAINRNLCNCPLARDGEMMRPSREKLAIKRIVERVGRTISSMLTPYVVGLNCPLSDLSDEFNRIARGAIEEMRATIATLRDDD
jgi:hypothetical protein